MDELSSTGERVYVRLRMAADSAGRFYGDAEWVLSKCFSCRVHLSVDEVEYRERLAKIGLGGSFERDFAVQIGHRRKSLLVLDEFQRGIGYKGEGRDLSLDFFEEVVNARYNAELDTVIVANWTQEDFNQFMPDSVKDRVIQRRSENRGGVRWCDWRSFRRA